MTPSTGFTMSIVSAATVMSSGALHTSGSPVTAGVQLLFSVSETSVMRSVVPVAASAAWWVMSSPGESAASNSASVAIAPFTMNAAPAL